MSLYYAIVNKCQSVFEMAATLEVMAQLRKAQRRDAGSSQLISRAAAMQPRR